PGPGRPSTATVPSEESGPPGTGSTPFTGTGYTNHAKRRIQGAASTAPALCKVRRHCPDNGRDGNRQGVGRACASSVESKGSEAVPTGELRRYSRRPDRE